MATLVVCIDGTGNHPNQVDVFKAEEVRTATNVLLAWRVLTNPGTNNRDQPTSGENYGVIKDLIQCEGKAQYLSGIGTLDGEGKTSQAFGLGMTKRICDAYQFLSREFKDGDQIYCFGFSRGAFAVRSLAGMINFVGLSPNPRITEKDVERKFGAYLKKPAAGKPHMKSVQIHFLGLWDTVGSTVEHPKQHKISPSNVKVVAQALALDEERTHFKPEFWTEEIQANRRTNPPVGKRSRAIKEVWFAGAHSNVGGGYKDDNLSNIPFFWVMEEARKAGLSADLKAFPPWHRELSSGPRRDSVKEFYKFNFGDNPDEPGFLMKVIQNLAQMIGTTKRAAHAEQLIHRSVVERMYDSKLTPRYQPLADIGKIAAHSDLLCQMDNASWGKVEEWNL